MGNTNSNARNYTSTLWALLLLLALFLHMGCLTQSGDTHRRTHETLADDFLTVKIPVLNSQTGLLDSQTLLIPQPSDNPLTQAGVELGMFLFHDVNLSGNRAVSCAFCHNQQFAFSDNGSRFSMGVTSQMGEFNAPALVNVAFDTALFWNGRAGSLEEQALGPVTNPIEMGASWEEAAQRLGDTPWYPEMFRAAFGSEVIDSTSITKAIAQYERTLLSFDSKYDQVRRGEAAFTESEARGSELFFSERGGCFHCHNQPLFTDHGFHNNGLVGNHNLAGTGRGAVTGNPEDDGLWKTPTLRNIAFTFPYMHDGRLATLAEVIDFYAGGGEDSRTLDKIIAEQQAVRRDSTSLRFNPFSTREREDLAAFLHTLSDSGFVTNRAYRP